MAQITNAALMNEINSLKERMQHLEKAVEEKNTNISLVVSRVNAIETQLKGVNTNIQSLVSIGKWLLTISTTIGGGLLINYLSHFIK